MKQKTLDYIVSIIRNYMNEEVAAVPTNSASSGEISGLSGKEGDLPPVDLRKKRYKKLPGPYKDLFRRKK